MRVKRTISIMIDLILTMMIVLSPFLITKVIFNMMETNFAIVLQNVMVASLYLSKDLFFSHGSFGKKICKLQLLTVDDRIPSNIVKILRNITIFIWPVEAITLIIFNKRLGDIIFKTKVVAESN